MNVTLDQLILVPLAVALGFLLVLTLVYNQRERGRRVRGGRRAALYRCVACGHVYEDSRRVPLAGCPRCGTLNEAVRR